VALGYFSFLEPRVLFINYPLLILDIFSSRQRFFQALGYLSIEKLISKAMEEHS
jgi:hypothetical protein